MDIFLPLKFLGKVFKVKTDTWTFKFSYMGLFPLFFAVACLTVLKYFMVDPIECQTSILGDTLKFAHLYCLTSSKLYIVLNGDMRNPHGHVILNENAIPDYAPHRFLIRYYPMIPYFLFAQGFLYVLPKLLWYFKATRIGYLVQDLDNPALESEQKFLQRSNVVRYFCDSHKFSNNRTLFMYSWLTELSNHAISYLNFWVIGRTLGSYTYGLGFFNISLDDPFMEKPLNSLSVPQILFPGMVKCEIPFTGVGGSYTPRDGLCTLPLNYFYSFAYIPLWFGSAISLLVGPPAILNRLLILLFPCLRYYELIARTKHVDRSQLKFLSRTLSVSNYVTLSLVGANLPTSEYSRIIKSLSQKLLQLKNSYEMV